jgi:hypothetical protein
LILVVADRVSVENHQVCRVPVGMEHAEPEGIELGITVSLDR